MSRIEEIYKPALSNKKLPVLTLDHKWHQLFTQTNSNKTIKELEKKLNELVQKQGKLTSDMKEIRKIKSRLMDEIISLREKLEDHNDKSINKKLTENTRLITECNEKTEEYQDILMELPKEIQEINLELMIETMTVCYATMHANARKVEEIKKWTQAVRIELKKKLVRKQQSEIMNQELYHYMHDIFGADVIEIFDMKFNEEEKKAEVAQEKISNEKIIIKEKNS